jgi:mRNA interferase MazF
MSETESLEVHRGDLVWVNCEPSVGAEPKKVRTCVVVSNDIANRFGQAVTVVPTQRYTPERAGRAYMVDLRAPRSNLKADRIANASMVTSRRSVASSKPTGTTTVAPDASTTPRQLCRDEAPSRVLLVDDLSSRHVCVTSQSGGGSAARRPSSSRCR